jgi:DNA-binding NtrC family response regulator
MVASGNAGFRKQMLDLLAGARQQGVEALGGADALLKLELDRYTGLLLDRQLPDLDAEELAGLVSSQYPQLEIEFCDSARPGAKTPPRKTAASGDLRRLLDTLRGAPVASAGTNDLGAREAPEGLNPGHRAELLPGLVGESAHLRDLSNLVRMVSPRRTTVLLLGETGTGKERIAHAVHQTSGRSQRPWVVVNCAAIPEALLESELFGYLRGAFTGAVQTRVGRILAAHTGTLFLDEIGEMPLMLQAKLLRFLQEGELQRLGSNEAQRVDVRVVAATNQDLAAAVEAGRFRRDLYYRLAVFPIELQPLRARPQDVLPLARHFLRELQADAGATVRGGAGGRNCDDSRESQGSPECNDALLTPEAEALLEGHHWPGNVRELQHTMERALILCDGRGRLGTEYFPALQAPPPVRFGPRRAE